MRGKAIDKSTIQKAKKLKRQGVPYRQIANKLGISLAAIAENTKEVKALERATRKYPEATAEEEPVQHPRVIRPEHQRPLHFEGHISSLERKKPETAAELRERYKQQNYYRDEILKEYREFNRLLSEGTVAEAKEAFERHLEAQRKYDEFNLSKSR